jgi:hypothetical protein
MAAMGTKSRETICSASVRAAAERAREARREADRLSVEAGNKRMLAFKGPAQPSESPLFAFAGIWTTFNGDRGTKSKPVPGPHQVYGFLTTPNVEVEPIHPKAMPVILTTEEEREVWLRAPVG